MNRTEKRALLDLLIATNAATAERFFTAHAKPMGADKNANKVCVQHFKAERLFRVRASQTTHGYFATQALADAYHVQHQFDVRARAATKISIAPKAPKGHMPRTAVETVHPAHVRVQVSLMLPQRIQFTALPSFIHNGYGAMR